MKTPYRFLPDLFLRTPFYSIISYDLARLPEIIGQQTFQNAIRLASPVLYDTLQKKQFDYGRLQEKEKHALAKYYNRMCYRPTPFGAFAAFSLLRWGTEGPIRLAGDHQAKLHLLPDQTVIHRLNRLLGADELILNPALYTAGREFRFITSMPDEKGHYRFGLESISDLPFHTALFELLRKGPCSAARLREQIILQSACSAEDAADYLDFLIDSQVLFGPGRGHLISSGDKAGRFADLERTVPATDPVPGTTGAAPYYAAVERPLESGALDTGIRNELYGALDVLSRLSYPNPTAQLSRFISDFSARYDLEKVPLLRALDPDTGIPYGDLGTEDTGDDLLDDIHFPAVTPPANQIDWQPVRRLFMRLWPGGETGGSITLSNSDLQNIGEPANLALLPSVQAMMFRTAGDRLLIEHAGGPTANNLNGRFSRFSADAHQLCLDLAGLEQLAHPDILFADIGHLSDTHTDNISRRRQIYPYEIPLNVYPDLGRAAQLLPADLLLSVRGGALILESASLEKRVIPRLASAYNFHKSGLGLFRLLCDLQYQDMNPPRSLDLAQLFPGLNYYPRVSYGRCILSLACWRFLSSDLEILQHAAGAGLMPALRQFRGQHRLPQHISLGSADQQLVFNLSEPDEAEFFIRCIGKQGEVKVQEYLLPDKTVKAGNEPLAGQFIAYLSHQERVYKPLQPEKTVPPGSVRQFRMGSEWLYLKIYGTPRTADQLLTKVIAPAAESLGEDISGWFFIRYEDPGYHLRLRFKLKTEAISHLMAAIHERLEHLGQDELIRSYQSDAYQRELERYGPELMEKAEDIFCAGSRLVLAFLNLGPEHSWTSFRLAISTLDRMTALFFPGSDERIRFVSEVSSNLTGAYGAAKNLRLSLDQQYRRHRQQISEWLAGPDPVLREMDDLSQQLEDLGHITKDYPEERKTALLADLAHMQLNRTFSSRPRQKELLVYFCLHKHLLSQRARSAG